MDESTHVLSKEEFMAKVRARQKAKDEKKKRLESEKKAYIMDRVIGAAVYRKKHRP